MFGGIRGAISDVRDDIEEDVVSADERRLEVLPVPRDMDATTLARRFSRFGEVEYAFTKQIKASSTGNGGVVVFQTQAARDAALRCAHVVAGVPVHVGSFGELLHQEHKDFSDIVAPNECDADGDPLPRPPGNAQPTRLFIGALPRRAEEEALRRLMQQFGEIASVLLKKDRNTGENRGFAFIEYAEPLSVRRAMAHAKKKRPLHLDGRALDLNWAAPVVGPGSSSADVANESVRRSTPEWRRPRGILLVPRKRDADKDTSKTAVERVLETTCGPVDSVTQHEKRFVVFFHDACSAELAMLRGTLGPIDGIVFRIYTHTLKSDPLRNTSDATEFLPDAKKRLQLEAKSLRKIGVRSAVFAHDARVADAFLSSLPPLDCADQTRM